MELTEEQLKTMTPEQLRELQKANCIFCHIVSGKVQSKKIYEDDDILAVLDINPCNPGHALIFTKDHHAILPQVPEAVAGKLLTVCKVLSAASLRALKTQGTNIFIANGVAAGQKAPHLLVHMIPRDANDGITIFNLERNPSSDEHTAWAGKLKARLEGKPLTARPAPGPREDDEPEEDRQEESREETQENVDLDSIAKVLGLQ